MGDIFRRRVRVCTACDERLDTTAARRACETSGDPIEVREQGIWWIKYVVDSRRRCEASRRTTKAIAEALLRQREAAPTPLPPTAAIARPPQSRPLFDGVSFEEAAQDLLNDYQMNRRRPLRTVRATMS